MTSNFLSTLYDFFRCYGDGRAEDFLQHLFPSYFFSRTLDNLTSLASHILTGYRPPPRAISIFYADLAHSHAPRKLHEDSKCFIKILCSTTTERKVLYALLQAYTKALPELDQMEILREHLNTCTGSFTAMDLADLLTRLLWHALCWDAAAR
jgi:hypothetical protein